MAAEDWDLWIRISEVSQISCINKTLVKVRIHNKQISKYNDGFEQAYDSRISIISYWYRKNKIFLSSARVLKQLLPFKVPEVLKRPVSSTNSSSSSETPLY